VLSSDENDRIRLLIVDDDHRVRNALGRLLTASTGFLVVGTVDNALAAHEVAEASGPDVALVDVLLPNADDGLGLTSSLTAVGIPVVAMSIDGGMRRRALAAGAQRFLDKDCDPEAIARALRVAVMQHIEA
jgi:DNA-binding NarL/FixJ family response regulator